MTENNEYRFFPGCLIRARLPHVEKSARLVLNRLGVGLSEVEGASCCPNPVYFRDLDHEAWLMLAARNLAIAGKPMMTLCSGCYSTFREAEHALDESPMLRRKIGEHLDRLGLKLPSGSRAEHFARFLYEKVGPAKLEERVVRSLKGLKVVFHPGCHLVRPSRIHEFDDPDNPTKLEELVWALGAEVLDYPRKMLCCGFTVMGVDRDLSLRMGFEKLKIMKESGAQAVVLVCPSCMVQLDRNQRLIEQEFDTKLSLPVFYLTELIGLAFGESSDSLGLGLHLVDVEPLVRELLGLEEDRDVDVSPSRE
ncbi:MAG: CoB--CoM heterodisulfide reductase iron-sulfur subunit B family protein [Deltaproteobacteria bacterium]|nr:CoB--CoM heterodisulfide reductase iron-sulfur subunit B family protein [Deltaproteobacteria bacterium]